MKTKSTFDNELNDDDVLVITASEYDMCFLDQTLDPTGTTDPNITGKSLGKSVDFSNNSPIKGISQIKTEVQEHEILSIKEGFICNEESYNLTLDILSTQQTNHSCILSEEGVFAKQIDDLQNVARPLEQVNKNNKDTLNLPETSYKPEAEGTEGHIESTKSPMDRTFANMPTDRNAEKHECTVKHEYPCTTPEKKINQPVDPNISPDIFDEETINNKPSYFDSSSKDNSLGSLTQAHTYVHELDTRFLKNTLRGMCGVLPPSSVTVINMSVQDILAKLEENKKYYFWNWESGSKDGNIGQPEGQPDTSMNSSTESHNFSKSFLINVGLEEAKNSRWPDILDLRCHGLHYNCGNISEEIVDLCDKFQKRFVGAETQSTCTVFETQNVANSSRRKMTKPRWGGKSPGRRLSHLAKRRITFSSANLQAGAGASSLSGAQVASRCRQILVDAKKNLKFRRRSPKKTPRKSPKKTPKKSPRKLRTPSRSAKLNLATRFRKITNEIQMPNTSEISSVNRALFQSPDRVAENEKDTDKSQNLFALENRCQLKKPRPASSQGKIVALKRQKPSVTDSQKLEVENRQTVSDKVKQPKFARSVSELDVVASSSNVNKSLSRSQSELHISLIKSQSQNELSEKHKKKLLWAVSGALQSQNITNKHPQWKVFASVLARVIRRRFCANPMSVSGGVSAAKPEGGTSERMRRIARHHVISVIKGKSVDEIIDEYVKGRAKVPRPQGYVAPNDVNDAVLISKTKQQSTGSKIN